MKSILSSILLTLSLFAGFLVHVATMTIHHKYN